MAFCTHCLCVLLMVWGVQHSAFMLKTTRQSITPVTTTFVTTVTIPTTETPDVQSARAMVMKEVDEGVKLEARFDSLKQNITDRVKTFRLKLNKRNANSSSQLNHTKASIELGLEKIATDLDRLKYNLSKLRETELERVENEVKSTKDDLQNVQHTTDIQSGFTVISPENGQAPTTAKFETVITNMGHELNISGTEFVCEQPGLYLFSLIIYKTGFGNSAICRIRHNASSVIQAYLNPNSQVDYGFYSSGNSVFLHLAKDDKVDVGSCSDLRLLNPLNHRTVFTGFLLKPDF